MDKVTEILTLAKEILESEVEWCQNRLYGYKDIGIEIVSACSLGALDIAAARVFNTDISIPRSDDHRIASNMAERRLMDSVPSNLGIADYNDNPQTSKEDVLLMFKRAIEND